MAAALLKAVVKANAAIGGHAEVSRLTSARQEGGGNNGGGRGWAGTTGTGAGVGGDDNPEVRFCRVCLPAPPSRAVSGREKRRKAKQNGDKRTPPAPLAISRPSGSTTLSTPAEIVAKVRVFFFLLFSLVSGRSLTSQTTPPPPPRKSFSGNARLAYCIVVYTFPHRSLQGLLGRQTAESFVPSRGWIGWVARLEGIILISSPVCACSPPPPVVHHRLPHTSLSFIFRSFVTLETKRSPCVRGCFGRC